MPKSLASRLGRSLRSNFELVRTLEDEWSGSRATNGLKVWLADEMKTNGRRFWANFKGDMGSFGVRQRELVHKGTLSEMEFLLDVIAFDRNSLEPSFGAEIEQSYSKKREQDPDRDGVMERIVRRSAMREQKDVEFYYDFSRLLAVAPTQGVFIGLSYQYEEALRRWVAGCDDLLQAVRDSGVREIAIMFILTVPRQGDLNLACYEWSPGGSLQDLGITPLRLSEG